MANVVYKKLSRYTFLVIPCSTKLKDDSWFVNFVFGGVKMITCLHQARVIDYRRLDNKMDSLSTQDFNIIKKSFTPNPLLITLLIQRF